MALTVGTQKLGLQNVLGSNKSVILVKLTDSSLRTIEQFLKKQSQLSHTSNLKPVIEFLQNTGSISIPVGDDGRQAKFSFSLSSTDDINGPQGGFECLQSTNSRSLDTLGAIQEKINIHASDDTYTRFGEKMVEVKKDNEKRSTVFIDRPGGAKAPINRPGQQFVRKPGISSVARPTIQKEPIRDKPVVGPKPVTGGPGNRYPNNPSDNPARNNPILDRLPYAKSNAIQKIQQKQQNSEIIKRPLRERIVHLLAMRPFKKPELLSRIGRDGFREKDKNSVMLILKQVSTMKDNTFHLLRHIWNDVSEDWPFYTEEERQSFRRRKPQNLTPPGSDGSSGSSIVSGHSSSSSHPASPQPTSTLKRGPSLNRDRFFDGSSDLSGPTSKKIRTSNYVRPPDLQVGSENFNRGKSPQLLQSPNRVRNSPFNDPRSNEGKVSGWLMANGVRSSPTPHKATTGPLNNPASSPESQYCGIAPKPELVREDYNARDFLTKFTRIENDAQRQLYKAEFNKDHNVYREHHGLLERVSKRFVSLENQFKQAAEGSEFQRRLKQQICEEYYINKKMRQEFQYLHEKLAHIKTLVHDYDNRRVLDSR